VKSVIQFEDVEFRRAGDAPVLRGITLSLAAGEMIAVVGRSGAGKSTLLKLANRLLTPTAGRVVVEGRDTADWDAIRLRRRIGYVFQDVGLFPHMTVEENIEIVPRLEGWPAARAARRARELLDLMELPQAEYGRRYPHELSGGQRQRIGVARALAIDPPILLMDEPFGALDLITRAELRRQFARLRRQLRTTVMMVTHDVAEAFALGDRVAVIDRGELVIDDVPARVAHSGDSRVRALVDAVPAFPG
jgi:osmoprotectant transport system ATP-binding protein